MGFKKYEEGTKKEEEVLVEEEKAYIMALRTPGNDRKTELAAKIRYELGLKEVENTSNVNAEQEKTKTEVKEENVEPEDYILTPELIYSGQIDPMIGMEDIKLEEKR